jgi:chromosome partitioning protein
MGVINQNAFLAADSIILVSDISLNGIQGAELFIMLWGNVRKQLRKEDNIKALILNNYDRRIKLSAELMDYCKENDIVRGLILDTVINASVQVKNTELEHKPINILHKNSTIHEVYKTILQELTKKGAI